MKLAPRWAHRIYAKVFGFFWTPCPLCGKFFGGHEDRMTRPVIWDKPFEGRICCIDCSDRVMDINFAKMPDIMESDLTFPLGKKPDPICVPTPTKLSINLDSETEKEVEEFQNLEADIYSNHPGKSMLDIILMEMGLPPAPPLSEHTPSEEAQPKLKPVTPQKHKQCFNPYATAAEENRRAQGLGEYDVVPHEKYSALIEIFYCIVRKNIKMTDEEFEEKRDLINRVRIEVLRSNFQTMDYENIFHFSVHEFRFITELGLDLKGLRILYMIAYPYLPGVHPGSCQVYPPVTQEYINKVIEHNNGKTN